MAKNTCCFLNTGFPTRGFTLFSTIVALAFSLLSCSPSDDGNRKTKNTTSKSKKNGESTADKEIKRVVKNLIKNKENLNQRYNSDFKKDDGKIPILLWAISHHDVESVALLLDNGADPDVALMKGSSQTPLFEVSHGTQLTTAADKKRFDTQSVSASICGMLIKAGADVNHKNRLGETPLMKAAGKGREDICAILIAAGADINHADRMGSTALHAAAKYGYWKVVALLLKKGAKPNVKNRRGATPLSLAEKRADEKLHNKCRKVLPEAYANANYDKTIDALKKQ